MYSKEILLAAICLLLLHGPQFAHSVKCGCLERPRKYKTCRDPLCRPDLTPDFVKKNIGPCVCRLGGFRNPWGHCITLEECRKCSTHPHKSYNLCASECPMTCDQPIPNCSSRCVVGCDCAPGYVRDKANPEKCIKADCCPPKCPANSKFELCISNCRRTCDRQQPRKCFTSCTRGGCVCNKGFSELVVAGVTTCVPDFQCPKTQQRRDI